MPTVLLVTSCSWTARAIELSLAAAGLATARADDVPSAELLASAASCDALLIDERVGADGTHLTDRGAAACRRLLAAPPTAPPLPLMVLAREPMGAHEQDTLHAAGAWGVAPYPLGGPAWVGQLAAWIRATGSARALLDRGLVDPITGLYNARGLEQRAAELDAGARRLGDPGPLACAVFALGGSPAERVADACRRVGRAADVFGRVGDREFAVIAPGADADGARALVGRIADAVATDDAPPPRLRVGICAAPEARVASLSVADMLAHAASRA